MGPGAPARVRPARAAVFLVLRIACRSSVIGCESSVIGCESSVVACKSSVIACECSVTACEAVCAGLASCLTAL